MIFRYGALISHYASLTVAIETLFLSSIGRFDYVSHMDVDGTSAPAFLMVYLLTTLVFFINMVITLLNEFLAAVKQDPEAHPKDHEVVQYFIQSLKSLLGFRQVSNDDNHSTGDHHERFDRPAPVSNPDLHT